MACKAPPWKTLQQNQSLQQNARNLGHLECTKPAVNTTDCPCFWWIHLENSREEGNSSVAKLNGVSSHTHRIHGVFTCIYHAFTKNINYNVNVGKYTIMNPMGSDWIGFMGGGGSPNIYAQFTQFPEQQTCAWIQAVSSCETSGRLQSKQASLGF